MTEADVDFVVETLLAALAPNEGILVNGAGPVESASQEERIRL
jgi:hypothetical protein